MNRVSDLLLVGFSDFKMILYNSQLQRCRQFEGHHQAINDMCFSEHSKYIYSVSMDRQLIVWDIISQKIINRLTFPKPINSLAISKDGELIALAPIASRSI